MTKRVRVSENFPTDDIELPRERRCCTLTICNAHRNTGSAYDYGIMMPCGFQGLHRVRVSAHGTGSKSRTHFLQFRAPYITNAYTTFIPDSGVDCWVTVMPLGVYEPREGLLYMSNINRDMLEVRYVDENGEVVGDADNDETLVLHLERID